MTKSILQLALLMSVIATAVLGFTTDVQAQCERNRCNGLVDRLYTSTDNFVLVETNGNEADLDCKPFEGRYLRLFPSQHLFTQIYNSLLEAVTLGRTARVRVTNADDCQIVYVILFRSESSLAEAESEE
jgi:hypothetical protein